MNNFLEFRIREIVKEAQDAITLVLEEVCLQSVFYHSGQFLTLLININGRELRRSYSLNSAPGIDPYISITIKRVVNGEVSRFLIDHLKKGDVIRSLPPAGRFIFQPDGDKQRDIYLIGAGSGMTPLFSILKTTLHKESKSKVTLINSNRNETTALYWEQLRAFEKMFAQSFTMINLFSDPNPEMKQHFGRLNIGLLEDLINKTLHFKKEEAEFYVCGPFEYMRMVRMTLIYMGFHEDQIHRENYLSKTTGTEAPPPEFPSRTVKISFRGKEEILRVPSGKTILKAVLDNGISLPFSCQAGVCSTCIGLCKSGEVYMFNNQVLTPKELQQGLVLTCVSYPKTEDVWIEVN